MQNTHALDLARYQAAVYYKPKKHYTTEKNGEEMMYLHRHDCE